MNFVPKRPYLPLTQGSAARLVFVNIILLLTSVCFAQTAELNRDEIDFYQKKGILPFIASEQDGDYPAGTYLVLHDLTIAKGKIMTLYPGTKILFVKDTRLIVNGLLICQGKDDEPVVFDKLDNSSYYTPVDSSLDSWWDGIHISDSATLEMKHALIKNSKYGIVAGKASASITLDTVRSRNNKYQFFRFGDEMPNIQDNKPFSLMWSGFDTKAPEINFIDTSIVISAEPSLHQGQAQYVALLSPEQKKRTTEKRLRWTFGTTTVVGAALGVTGFLMGNSTYQKYQDTTDPENLDNKNKVDSYHKKTTLYDSVGYTGTVISAVGLSALTLTFVF